MIYDDGSFEGESREVKARIVEIGAKSVFLGEEGWYWDLIPDHSIGAAVEI